MIADEFQRLSVKTVVLTCMNFCCWGGSQQFVIDLARVFTRNGIRVMIITDYAHGEIIQVASRSGIQVVSILEKGWVSALPRTVDFFWGLHWPLVGAVLLEAGIRFRYAIQTSLSHFEPVEVVWFGLEQTDVVVFGNRINAEIQLERLDGLKINRTAILANSLPEEWFQPVCRIPEQPIIAVITNHIAPEIHAVIPELRAAGFHVDIIGAEAGQVLVDCELMDRYCAVIAIGQTVQKAMSRGRSVFVYDRFGGTGWLSPDQIEDGEPHNFSGRVSGRRMDYQQLAKAIVSGFEAAKTNAHALRKVAEERYRLEKNIAGILEQIPVDPGDALFRGVADPIARGVVQAYWRAETKNGWGQAVGLLPPHMVVERTLRTEYTCGERVAYTDIVVEPAVTVMEELDLLYIAGNVVLDDGMPVARICVVRDDGVRWLAQANLPSPWLTAARPDMPGIDRAFYDLRAAVHSDTRQFDVAAYDAAGDCIPLARIVLADPAAQLSSSDISALKTGQNSIGHVSASDTSGLQFGNQE